MHEWRKRVKDLRYAAEMLQRREPSGASRREGKRKRRRERERLRAQAAPLRRLAKRADDLGELLGEEHDLVLLEELVRSCPVKARDERRGGAGA